MTIPVTLVNIGTNPNDNTGDPAQVAFTKINTSLTSLASNAGGVVTVTSPDNSVAVVGSPGNTLALQIAAAFQGAFNILPGKYLYAGLPAAASNVNVYGVSIEYGPVFSNGVYWEILFNQTSGSLAISNNTPLTPATQSVAYSQALTATGGVSPYTWSLVSKFGATNNWTITGSNLVGTPSTITTDTLTFQVSDTSGAIAQKTVSLQTVAATTPAATPTFSPVAGTYVGTQAVTISDSTPSSTIYYTTNGVTPTTGSTVYTTPVSVAANTTLKAIATAAGFTQSAVGSAVYSIVKPLGSVLADSLSYFGTEQAFLNLMKAAGQAGGNYQGTGWLTTSGVGGADTNEGTALTLDTNGYPVQIPQAGLTGTCVLAYVCWSIPTSPGAALAYPSGVYRLQFTGTGTIVIDGGDASLGSGTGTNGLTFANAGTGTVSFTFTASGLCSGGTGFRLSISSSNPSNNGNQVRAISIVQNSLTTSFDGGAIFHPNFLASCTGYTTYRFINWLKIDTGEFMFNTGTCSNGSTALTLGTSFKEATGTYPIVLPTGQFMNATFTRNSTAVTLSAGASAAIATNVYPVTFLRSWASRSQTSWCFYSTGYGVPHEMCIALANLLGAHCFVETPLTMSDADHASIATLYHTTLNTNLNCYPELSNETWNSGFIQYAASAYLGAGVFAASLGSQNDYSLNYKGYRTAVMAEIWKTAWGTTDFARCFPIYGASEGNTYSATEGLNTPFWTGVIDGYSGPAKSHPIKRLAIAPYFPVGGGLISAADANKILAQSDGGLGYFFQALYSSTMVGGTNPGVLASMQPNGFLNHTLHGGGGYANVDGYIALMPSFPTLSLVGYEGGNQFNGGDPGGTTPGIYTWTQLLDTANRDSRMATAYATLLAYWATNVGATQANFLCLYNHCDAYAGFQWGAIESVMQLANSFQPQRYLAEHGYMGA